MEQVKWIFFDCMETLVDLTELPTVREYALWAFDGSGTEHYWTGFEEFLDHYELARKSIGEELPKFKEYEMRERLAFVVRLKMGEGQFFNEETVTESLYQNYWVNYTARCFVQDEVKRILALLNPNFRLGVVSNFMVPGGVEELLKRNEIAHYFDFVITSITEGWKKPHPYIFQAALEKSGVVPQEVLFVGDDYVCDYTGPRKMGIRSVLLDRNSRYLDVRERISNLTELGSGFTF